MKKVILTKSNSKSSALKITSPDNVKSKLAYAELFRAVLQIPEKDVQNRILDAVNGRPSTAQIVHALCPNCKQSFGNFSDTQLLHKEVATQTDVNGIIPCATNTTPNGVNSNTNSDDSRDRISPALQKYLITSTPNVTPTQQDSKIDKSPVKRKRKRKVCLPQVVKRSHAQLAHMQLQPKLKSRKVDNLKITNMDHLQSDELSEINLFDRRYSISSITSDMLFDLLNTPDERSKEEHIMRTMAEEYLNVDKRTDGLLTIHHTIIANDLFGLRRQIFVWKKLRKVLDLNHLLTDEDENCLQLAIIQDCFPKIIDVLLNEGLNANEIDDHSNSCVHLAILNEIETESLRLLMQKIDPKILLQLNDDGYTPLHIAVRTNSYLRAEIMLNTLDERLRTNPLFHRNVQSSTETDFSKYYEDICKTLEQKYGNMSRNAQPKLKKKFLETGDRKSGSTALFFAIENKLEHFVFFLLAHLTDPRVLNFSGQDAKSYYSEFGKMLQLSLKVDSAIENVVTLLG
ncbi:uncharacterized protein LOC128863616 [Anastrepha ludens]|uniref:uncharacterized protein LOC128863616 n=1 Tax=Anastrepha ludens TaxID=28586 RepID=UPI0023B0072B|nr:uncharacterized protein LOC128863616 [Anastrepha ludens]XP_053958832.1 uncharacterized protein LOC128863616 [Anastrepha ludens]